MYFASETGWGLMEAERAFGKAVRARRRASAARRVMRRCLECAQLATFEANVPRRSGGRHGVREIPLGAIAGSLEPNRAADFDAEFRPSDRTRGRWLNGWLAFERGVALPPISVTAVGDVYAISDGHHRVSVARARGAATIAAIVG